MPNKPTHSDEASTDKAGRQIDKRVVAGVAGIAVGSAAIAAALLFAGRTAKTKAAATTPPPPKVPIPDAAPIVPATPNASAIKVAKAD